MRKRTQISIALVTVTTLFIAYQNCARQSDFASVTGGGSGADGAHANATDIDKSAAYVEYVVSAAFHRALRGAELSYWLEVLQSNGPAAFELDVLTSPAAVTYQGGLNDLEFLQYLGKVCFRGSDNGATESAVGESMAKQPGFSRSEVIHSFVSELNDGRRRTAATFGL